MRDFIAQQYRRLEASFLQCSAYTGDALSIVAVCLYYTPLFSTVFLLIQTVYDRTWFHVVVSLGITIALLLNMAAESAPWWHEIKETRCDSSDMEHPSQQMTIVMYVMVAFVAWGIHEGSKYGIVNDAINFVALSVWMISVALALSFLGVSTIKESTVGAAAGIVGAVIVLSILLIIDQFRETAAVSVFGKFMRVPTTHVRRKKDTST
jgi:FtsH-binding integral membrane protein